MTTELPIEALQEQWKLDYVAAIRWWEPQHLITELGSLVFSINNRRPYPPTTQANIEQYKFERRAVEAELVRRMQGWRPGE